MAKQTNKIDDSDVRHELSADFITRLRDKWLQVGDAVLDELATKSPEKFALLVSTLVPREMLFPDSTKPAVPQNSREIAIALLGEVGLTNADDEAHEKALRAYDLMIATLEQIRTDALGVLN